ncbi:MAG TPA: subclass B3 metallo-beta-lactamase [Bryobacteraceae bacterium]|jgi:metallo-beta-lactamase class B|nr:subclass B3 metallo-beta-lactamase [Bryobacteraceae bacterium]
MRIRRILTSIVAGVLSTCGATVLSAQNNADQWSQPFPPHKIIGNLYYVGSSELATYLITTPDGNVLINSDFERTVPVIRAAVEKLGFRFSDTKILLGSHAHGDHMEGDALLKELTGAKVMAMEQDLPALRKMTPGNKPHPIDRILHDGDEVTLGGTTLVAHLTPGHTKGCTTWTMKAKEGDKTYDVVIVGSVNVNPGFILVGNKDYPEIASDYVRSFKVLKALPCDIFLGAHGNYYGMTAKYAKLEKGGANPFIDPAGYKAYIAEREQAFQANLEKQKAAAK